MEQISEVCLFKILSSIYLFVNPTLSVWNCFMCLFVDPILELSVCKFCFAFFELPSTASTCVEIWSERQI